MIGFEGGDSATNPYFGVSVGVNGTTPLLQFLREIYLKEFYFINIGPKK